MSSYTIRTIHITDGKTIPDFTTCLLCLTARTCLTIILLGTIYKTPISSLKRYPMTKKPRDNTLPLAAVEAAGSPSNEKLYHSTENLAGVLLSGESILPHQPLRGTIIRLYSYFSWPMLVWRGWIGCRYSAARCGFCYSAASNRSFTRHRCRLAATLFPSVKSPFVTLTHLSYTTLHHFSPWGPTMSYGRVGS